MAQKQTTKVRPTPGERTRNFLLYGIGLSMLTQLLVGPPVKFNRTVTTEEAPRKVTIAKAPTPPTS